MSEQNGKPVFDEQTLSKVLEAAYVLQEHNREKRERELREAKRATPPLPLVTPPTPSPSPLPASPPTTPQAKPVERGDYTVVLGQIVETQQQIQAQRLELRSAMTLIVQRASEIARADGAGIAVQQGGTVRYRAAAGSMALPIDAEVPIEKALCAACLRIGQVIRCGDVNLEFLVDAEECSRRGIQSLIAAPVYQGGNVVGALELYYKNAQAFTEPDVHTCQLMAGLVTEALGRSDELTWKKSLETEHTVMRDPLEKLKPSLEALAEPQAEKPAAALAPAAPPSVQSVICHKCGNAFVEDEQFCGECGLPRSSDYAPVSMQSKVAMLWQMHEAKKKDAAQSATKVGPTPTEVFEGPTFKSKYPADEFVDGDLPELFRLPQSLEEKENHPSKPPAPITNHTEAGINLALTTDEVVSEPPAEEALAEPEKTADWSSAAAARTFLERFSEKNRYATLTRFLRARRGDIYLAIALILIAFVVHWGLWPSKSLSASGNPVASAGHRKPGADLPFYDQILIKLGLAEAPPAPEYKGNPNTQVWIDVQTALYYCPGAELYGKTPKGRLVSQRDAQLDQYEPALRKPCD